MPPELRAVRADNHRVASLAWRGRGYPVAPTQLVALETIAFATAQCVGYHESFESGADRDGAYICQLTLTAPAFELRAGGAPAAAAVATASLQTAADVAAKGKAAATKVAKAAAAARVIAPNA